MRIYNLKYLCTFIYVFAISLLCACTSIQKSIPVDELHSKKQLLSLHSEIKNRLNKELNETRKTNLMAAFPSKNIVETMKEFETKIKECSPNDTALIAKLQEALIKWINNFSFNSFVTFVIQPHDGSADIKYRNVNDGIVKTARENPSQIELGMYYIWAEAEGNPISDTNNVYEIFSRSEKIILKKTEIASSYRRMSQY